MIGPLHILGGSYSYLQPMVYVLTSMLEEAHHIK
jgi:hypothetical protein